MSSEELAREQYNRETDNDPIIHSNRFPAWEELSLAERQRRIAALAPEVLDTGGLVEELQYAACALAQDGAAKQHVCWRAAAELSRLRALAKHWEHEALCLGEFAASYNRDEELQTLMKLNNELHGALTAATEDNKRLREALAAKGGNPDA